MARLIVFKSIHIDGPLKGAYAVVATSHDAMAGGLAVCSPKEQFSISKGTNLALERLDAAQRHPARTSAMKAFTPNVLGTLLGPSLHKTTSPKLRELLSWAYTAAATQMVTVNLDDAKKYKFDRGAVDKSIRDFLEQERTGTDDYKTTSAGVGADFYRSHLAKRILADAAMKYGIHRNSTIASERQAAALIQQALEIMNV